METNDVTGGGDAWFAADRTTFVRTARDHVVARLSSSAASQGWHVEATQHEEWSTSVSILQEKMACRARAEVEILRNALAAAHLREISDVILEYNFRRRGLRLDCVLLAPGLIAVLEFKRSTLGSADRDQITNYRVNLVEFHEESRRLCNEGTIIVPLLVLTQGRSARPKEGPVRFHPAPWDAVVREPICCDRNSLQESLALAMRLRKSHGQVSRRKWLASRFAPSSSILDAALSLYGQHEVSAIDDHAAATAKIETCVAEVAIQIQQARQVARNRIIFVSGAPGAGKTLVGLKIVFHETFRDDAVFVIGNAPLVDVLTEALRRSYRAVNLRSRLATGYPLESAHFVIQNSVFKIVKAHNFLGERGKHTASSDGNIIVFDEAQRTYEKGRTVLGKPLSDHEADLILAALEDSYAPGAVVVALLGHNQAINRGERGAIAWFEAAARRGWDFAISDETFVLDELSPLQEWAGHPRRLKLKVGHLSHSLRFFRNKGLEEWAHCVMTDDCEGAASMSQKLADAGESIWFTRDLESARNWVRKRRVGEERAGIIASGQARRLAAEGLFVDHKPSIAQWMLAPSGDVRSSNMLETVQNQYQIQGLELDYTIICWDVDLRREDDCWAAYKLRGAKWQKDKALEVAKNSYRVLLTRARRGMIIFVPSGDMTGDDHTRGPDLYRKISEYLMACGVRPIPV